MAVLEERILHDLPVESSSGDHRQLRLQADALLHHQLAPAQGLPDRQGIGLPRGRHLALAVVAERRCLHHGRRPDAAQRVAQLRFGGGHFERHGGQTVGRQELLLTRPLLRNMQGHGRGSHRDQGFQYLGGRARHVLELERHHIDLFRERAQRLGVVVGRHHLDVGHLAGGRV